MSLLEGALDTPESTLSHAARVLDTLYIPTRYADSFADGAPADHYDEIQAGEAIEHAHRIIERSRLEMAEEAPG